MNGESNNLQGAQEDPRQGARRVNADANNATPEVNNDAGNAASDNNVPELSQEPSQEVRGRHARHAAPSDEASKISAVSSDDASNVSVEVLDTTDNPTTEESATDENEPAYMRRSRRTRRILVVVIIILVVLLALGGWLAWTIFNTAQQEAEEQAISDEETVTSLSDETTDDSAQDAEKITTVPELLPLMGLTVDEAVEQLQHGAEVSSTQEVTDEESDIKSEVRVVLTSEPTDARSGTPTVYLGLDEAGLIIQAGYSAASSALGYGSLSFEDAVVNEKIIENTLYEAGIDIGEDAVNLPENKEEYSTYASDGTTLSREYCSFSGTVNVDGEPIDWSAVLSYDYVTANVTGNLADTIRTIYVYVGG